MALEIRDSNISELENAPNIHDLLLEYAAESAIKGLPHPSAKVSLYKTLEQNNSLHTIGAFLDGILIGYINILYPILPHYGAIIAVAESYFVAKEQRKTGAGLKLLRAAQEFAKTKNSPGILVSAPIGGDLAEVLPRVGYTETNRVFFMGFGDE